MKDNLKPGDLVEIKVKSLYIGVGVIVESLLEDVQEQGVLFNAYKVLTYRGVKLFFSFELSKIDD